MKESGYAEQEETSAFSRQVRPFPIHRQKGDKRMRWGSLDLYYTMTESLGKFLFLQMGAGGLWGGGGGGAKMMKKPQFLKNLYFLPLIPGG